MSSPVEFKPSNIHTEVSVCWDVTLWILVERCKHIWRTLKLPPTFILKKAANFSESSVRTKYTTRRQSQKTMSIKITLATSDLSFTCINYLQLKISACKNTSVRPHYTFSWKQLHSSLKRSLEYRPNGLLNSQCAPCVEMLKVILI